MRPATIIPIRPSAKLLAANESHVLDVAAMFGWVTVLSFPVDPQRGDIARAAARTALASLFRRGLVTRVGFGDSAVYRLKGTP